HPAVASTLNDLGVAALQNGDYRAAEADFRRMTAIYDSVYGPQHYLMGLSRANLASVYVREGRYLDADTLFRTAIRTFLATLPPDHMQTAIARIKLGHVLVLRQRWKEAEEPLIQGYETLSSQTSPTVSWLESARQDLVQLYEALGQPDKAAAYRAEQEDSTSG
ncbi:MAG: tetratricopeptide repeat protein, partial [Gemmatimonadota bacterium]